MRRGWGNPAPSSHPMQLYIIRRLLLIIPTIFIVTVIVFFSIRMIPGDVVDLMVAGMAGAGMIEDPRDAIREALGLDRPMLTQYGRWVGNLLRGDLGDAFVSSESVASLILNRLPVSLELGGHGAGHFPVDRAAGGDLLGHPPRYRVGTMSCAASRSC